MFDPSKLNLDLENKEVDKSLKPKEENSVKKIDTNNIKAPVSKNNSVENTDVLENLGLDKTSENIEKNNNTSTKTKQNSNIGKIEEIISPTLDKDKNGEEKVTNKVEEKNTVENIEKDESQTENKYNLNNKIIYDINLNSLDVLLKILVEKEYDFVTFEPEDLAVKVIFRKDKTIKETKYIKFPIYSNILLKAKALTKLTIEETEKEQEGSGEKNIKNNTYKIVSKVVPSETGSKLFLKAIITQKKGVKKNTKKTSLNQIITFLGAISFITLIIGAAFIGFIVINARTIEDVKFFYSLGINLNDINNFIGQALSIVFSILIFIETIFLVTFLFKFSLTKKEFKQKKIRYGILSSLLLIITFATASTWMAIDKKMVDLPVWEDLVYGDIQIYDNSKLLSDSFKKEGSIIKDYSNLIGPIQVKFDLSFFEKNEGKKGMSIKKYIWDFGNGEIIETPNSSIIYNFTEKGNYEVTLTVEEIDLKGTIIEKEVENIPSINIAYIVNIEEKLLNSGGKIVNFDASSLKELGKVEWYFIDNLDKPVWSDYIFRMSKPIFEETLIGMYIRRDDKTSEKADKVFIISGNQESNIDGKISYSRSILNDLEFELKVDNLKNDFGDGYIEKFKWIINNEEFSKKGDILDSLEASKIKYIFPSYGKYKVKVLLTNSAGKIKELETIIDIPKQLKLLKNLEIFNNNKLIENIEYEKLVNEYFINEVGVPTVLTFDTKKIRPDSPLYTLKKVSWDYNSDGDIDEVARKGEYKVNTEGNHTITVYYEFSHRKISNESVKVKEQIFIEGLKKDAIIDFDIIKKGSYVPIVVSFDASQSKVKDENIEKFVWDYGDGIIEERDAIVPGHKYSKAGNYNIKLTVITTSGKEYSSSKKLILKAKPQDIKITASLKKAEILQGIDFSSEKSEGQIAGYLWDFGDGNTSIKANPTHSYKKPGNYKVKLRLDFSNKNVLESSINITIFK